MIARDYQKGLWSLSLHVTRHLNQKLGLVKALDTCSIPAPVMGTHLVQPCHVPLVEGGRNDWICRCPQLYLGEITPQICA